MDDAAREFERMCQALALADGFQFVLLECVELPEPSLRGMFAAVADRVGELRGARPRLVYYEPYRLTTAGGALRDEAWVSGIIQPLVEPLSTGADPTLAIIDGTPAIRSDGSEMPSWIYLFHRLNEARNAIAQAFRGTLVLALPPALIRSFLTEASDFASISSGLFHADASTTSQGQTTTPVPLAPMPSRSTAAIETSTDSPLQQLHSFLLDAFSANELRSFAAQLPYGSELLASLPGPGLSSAHQAAVLLEECRRRGLLDELLFALRASFPRRLVEIDGLISSLSNSIPEPASTISPAHGPSDGSRSPVILFFSALVNNDQAFEFALETRAITAHLRRAPNKFNSIITSASSFTELRTALLRYNPNILHLRGHFMEGGSLYFEKSTSSSPSHLGRLLGVFRDELSLLVLDGTAEPSSELIARIPHIICISKSLSSASTKDFTIGFYEALSYGRSIPRAYEIARTSLADFELDDVTYISDKRRGSFKFFA